MAAKGPGLFSNFGKKSRDLLTKGYQTEERVTIISLGHSRLTGLSTTLLKKDGLISGNIISQFIHNNTVFYVKLDTHSKRISGTVIADILPSTTAIASLNLPEYNSSRLEVQYLHEHTSFTTASTAGLSPIVDISTTIGTPSIAFGAKASYSTSTGQFRKYEAGVSLNKPNSTASVILADKGDTLTASYLHHLSQLNGGAVVGEVTRRFSTNESTLTVGCSYIVDRSLTMKAKLNNHGNLGALLKQQVTPNSSLTVSGAFNTKNLMKNPKFGWSLNFKP